MQLINRYGLKMKEAALTLKSLLFRIESPRHMAVSVTVGWCIGIFPVVGITSMLCIPVIFLFRLNAAATITANLLASPLQLALIVPFWHLGRRIDVFGTGEQAAEAAVPGLLPHWSAVGSGLVHAIAVWAIFSVLIGLLFYLVLRKIQLAFARK